MRLWLTGAVGVALAVVEYVPYNAKQGGLGLTSGSVLSIHDRTYSVVMHEVRYYRDIYSLLWLVEAWYWDPDRARGSEVLLRHDPSIHSHAPTLLFLTRVPVGGPGRVSGLFLLMSLLVGALGPISAPPRAPSMLGGRLDHRMVSRLFVNPREVRLMCGPLVSMLLAA